MSLYKKFKGKFLLPIFKASMWFQPGCSFDLHTYHLWPALRFIRTSWILEELLSLWWPLSQGCCLVAPLSQNVFLPGAHTTQKWPSPMAVPWGHSCYLCVCSQTFPVWPHLTHLFSYISGFDEYLVFPPTVHCCVGSSWHIISFPSWFCTKPRHSSVTVFPGFTSY